MDMQRNAFETFLREHVVTFGETPVYVANDPCRCPLGQWLASQAPAEYVHVRGSSVFVPPFYPAPPGVYDPRAVLEDTLEFNEHPLPAWAAEFRRRVDSLMCWTLTPPQCLEVLEQVPYE